LVLLLKVLLAVLLVVVLVVVLVNPLLVVVPLKLLQVLAPVLQ